MFFLYRTTNKTMKNQRKNARKAASGRKGTVDEEQYLLGSFSRLADKFKTLISTPSFLCCQVSCGQD